jgi:Sulfotransferase family
VNPYVFIVGCPRSGTTLLSRIANAHRELAIVHESRWIARLYEQRRGLTPDGRVTPKIALRLRQPRSAVPFDVDADAMAAFVARYDGAPFVELVTALFDEFARRHQKPLAGDKSPGYVRYLALLHEMWPRARFVHIVRDGRDVFLSVRDWGKGAARFSTYANEPALTVARWWEWYVRLGREAGALLGPDRYHELSYESLVAQPDLQVARLCDFLGLPVDDRMLRFHEGRQRDDPRLDAKKAWRPVATGLRAWRDQMALEDVARFEAIAGDLLVELGYPLATDGSSAGSGFAPTVRAFDREVVASGRPVPAAWSAAS